MSNKKLTDKDLSLATRKSKAIRGRVDDIPKEESKLFMDAVYKVLGNKGIEEMKRVTYWFKHDILEANYRQIIETLEADPKGKEIVDRLLVNKKAYFTEAVCNGRRFYKTLTWEQKFIVLCEMYKIYNWKGMELDTVENKKYRDAVEFTRVLDEGLIHEWSVSVTGYCDTTINLLENKVSISDVLFWLQHDWKDLCGDYWIKQNSNTLSRRTNIFENKHYQAFNEVFKHVFGRDLKCLANFTGSNTDGILGRIKDTLGEEGA